MLESTKLCQHFIVMSFLCFALFFIESLDWTQLRRLYLCCQVCTMTFLMGANKGMEVILMQIPRHMLSLIHMLNLIHMLSLIHILMKMLMLMRWQVLTLTKVRGSQRVPLDNVSKQFKIFLVILLQIWISWKSRIFVAHCLERK